MPKPFLTAEWRNLLMANYPIEPSVLTPHLPCGTELDSFNGNCYVSLVGFLFANTKVLGLPVPLHRTFEEVNLRFYVRYKDDSGWKRGVVFLKEIVPRRMISFVANTLYGENYATHAMRHSYNKGKNGLIVCYEWKVGNEWNFMKAQAAAEPEILREGSEEEFITEHYWGYTFVNDTCSGTYRVAHPRWRIHSVTESDIFCSAEALYGPGFATALRQKPSSVFLAEGSAVSVMKGSRIFATKSNGH